MQSEDHADNLSTQEMTGAEFQRLVSQIAEQAKRFLDSLPSQPSWNVEGCETLAKQMSEPVPALPQPAEPIIDDLFERIIPVSYNTAGPGYLAYIPGGGLPEAALADLISNIVNRYVGVWITSPGLVQMEAAVIRWFCQFVGYPTTASGVLTTGGSLSNVFALYTARRCRGDNLDGAIIYTSNQAHHSVMKAASVVGFAMNQIRAIEVDDSFRIRLDVLKRHIQTDRADGMKPFAIVGNAGTTNTGAVDDLEGLATIAERESLWYHIDAAYGGFFVLTELGRNVLSGMERADTITLDPHKGLFLPYGTGCLLAKNQQHLIDANDVAAAYLPPPPPDPEFVDFFRLSPELSRDCRGLRVWLAMKLRGLDWFRRNLEEKLRLTVWVTEQLRILSVETGGVLEIVAAPQLSIVAFRLRINDRNEDELTQLNRSFLAAINRGKRVFLSATTLDHRFVLRICILSFRTHQDRIAECVKEIRRAMCEVGIDCT